MSKILIIDEDVGQLTPIRMELQILGHDVAQCRSADSALREILNNPAVDLLIIDLTGC